MKPLVLLCVLLVCGCATSNLPKREKGPDGTVAYEVTVETEPPGARIEADGELVGKSPVTIKIFGDKDGSFHNFGSDKYIIKAYPLQGGQNVQVKEFRTGAWFTPQDRIPKTVYFNLNLDFIEPKKRIEIEVK